MSTQSHLYTILLALRWTSCLAMRRLLLGLCIAIAGVLLVSGRRTWPVAWLTAVGSSPLILLIALLEHGIVGCLCNLEFIMQRAQIS